MNINKRGIMRKISILLTILACTTIYACDDSGSIETEYLCDRVHCNPTYCGDKCDRYLDDDSDKKVKSDYAGVDDENDESGSSDVVDSDGDGIPNSRDNCPDVKNTDQTDSNGNGLGDACEDDDEDYEDTDKDGIIDLKDNCRLVQNPDQYDSDGDGLGDACDNDDATAINDMDGDEIPDADDNCPRVANPDQADSNQNGIGDACDTDEKDPDTDQDGISDSLDNCPDTPNADQADDDQNGIGNACDVKIADKDGDKIADADDNCPDVYNPDQADKDQDGKGDACDSEEVVTDTADGSKDHPFVIKVEACATNYRDVQDTSKSTSSLIDVYPEDKQLNESGPEYYYTFTLAKRSTVKVQLDAEPDGVDIDLHLVKNLNISGKTIPESDLIARADAQITKTLDAGTYYIVADTFVSSGTVKKGKYAMNVSITPEFDGTKDNPILLNCGEDLPAHYVFYDVRSTADAKSKVFDKYGSNTTDESGPEFIYKFTIKEKSRFFANIRKPEQEGSDTDIHLLSSLEPKLIERADARIWTVLEPGTYYLTADACQGKTGKYVLDIETRPVALKGEHMFNDYILKAVEYLEKNWARKGYGSSAYTHDLPYGSTKVAKGPKAPLTMCVAAVAETILVAMDLYAKETGDTSVWDFLPAKSWASQTNTSIKGFIWVNGEINGGGTGDALSVFGMGMSVPFKELVPGSFINLNREKTGHAVVFISFLDKNCKEYETWNENIVGFKYYSSQGNATTGGFAYRYCHFSNKSFASCSGKTTDSAIWSEKQTMLNTGVIYAPKYWLKTSLASGVASATKSLRWMIPFNAEYFNGVTEE